MQALLDARKLIEQRPGEEAAKVLSALVQALEANESYELSDLYKLDFDTFGLAVKLISEWRLDRYYSSPRAPLSLSSQRAHQASQRRTAA